MAKLEQDHTVDILVGQFSELMQDFVAAGASAPQRYVGSIAFAFTGTASQAVYRIERASALATNLGSNSAWAPADTLPFDVTINPSAGAETVAYSEPAIGWWRVRFLSVTGGSVTLNVIGGKA